MTITLTIHAQASGISHTLRGDPLTVSLPDAMDAGRWTAQTLRALQQTLALCASKISPAAIEADESAQVNPTPTPAVAPRLNSTRRRVSRLAGGAA